MAFPGELNINYYKGDTYEFNIYPKKSDGTIFYLTNYGESLFKIATARGSDGLASQISALAQISDDGSYIKCTIRPADGRQLAGGVQYVYDVQITDTTPTPAVVYTLLTGTISVTEDVTGAI
jgi:hypothetical protein